MLSALVLLAACAGATEGAWVPDSWSAGHTAGWLLVSNSDPATNRSERAPSVGNGFVSTIVGSNDVFMAGVFNSRDSPEKSHRARLPSVHNIAVSPPGGEAAAHRRAFGLDTRRGLWLERLESDAWQVERRFYAHQTVRGLLVTEIEIKATDGDLTLGLSAAQQNGSWLPESGDFAFGPVVEVGDGGAGLGFVGCTHAGETGSPAWRKAHPRPPCTNVSVVYTRIPPTATTASGRHRTLRFVSAHASGLSDGADPLAAASSAYLGAMAVGDGELLALHTRGWAALLDPKLGGGVVDVRGAGGAATDLTRTVAASYYALLSAARADWPHGLSPGGLSTDGYEGHTFWDQETWMLPPLLAIAPVDLSFSLLEYRQRTMAGAAAKAAEFGYAGTMFAWESCVTGTDQYWFGDCGKDEHHITSDIGNALEQQWLATGNATWLKGKWPMIRGIADFWASRVTPCSSGQYCILDAMGPDEYHGNVNNSYYTALTARKTLRFAATACAALGGVGCAADPQWEKVADGLVLVFDEDEKYHPEFEGYARGVQVKQADTILAYALPLSTDFSPGVARNDLEYYANNTDPNGPAMTWASFAMAWLFALGDEGAAAPLFTRGYQTVRMPFAVWDETVGGGCGNFLTGAGGFLQSLVYGYSGLRYTETGGFVLTPRLPPGSSSLVLDGFNFQGNKLRIEVEEHGAELTLLSAGKKRLSAGGKMLEVGAAVTLALAKRVEVTVAGKG